MTVEIYIIFAVAVLESTICYSLFLTICHQVRYISCEVKCLWLRKPPTRKHSGPKWNKEELQEEDIHPHSEAIVVIYVIHLLTKMLLELIW